MHKLLTVLMAMVAWPISAQDAVQLGSTVAIGEDFWTARFGVYGGISFDVTDRLSVTGTYIQKGTWCCVMHAIEVPVVYRRELGDVAHLLVGMAPSYSHHNGDSNPDVVALLGLGATTPVSAGLTVALEGAIGYGLGAVIPGLGDYRGYVDRTIRVGVNIGRRQQQLKRHRLNVQIGPLVAAGSDFRAARFGVYGGIALDVADRLSVGAMYVQKGRRCCRVHAIEVPVVYRQELDEVAHVIIGVAPSYRRYSRDHYPDIVSLLGLGAKTHTSPGKTVVIEAVFGYGLLPAIIGYWGNDYRDRTFRVGLNIGR